MDRSERFLHLIHDIGGLAGNASDLPVALTAVARQIKDALGFDVVSVYVWNDRSGVLELVASQGLKLPQDHKVTLRPEEGLTGLVYSSGVTQVFVPASEHPRYKYFPELGEEKFDVFLGTPIRLSGKKYGVLVAQSTEQRLIEPAEEKLFEIVADRLAAALEVVAVLAQLPGDHRTSRALEMVQGRGVSRGLAVGPAFVITDSETVGDDTFDNEPTTPQVELARVEAAFEAVERSLMKLADEFQAAFPGQVATADADILRTQAVLMNDSAFRGQIQHRIRELGERAEYAVSKVAAAVHARFQSLDDPYFRDRADDMLDIGDRLLLQLRGAGDFEQPDAGAVLFAKRLGPVQLAVFAQRKIAGIVTEEGGANSHAAILARSLGIPAVTGAQGIMRRIRKHTRVLVDGRSGFVFIDPEDALVEEYAAAEAQQNATTVFPGLKAKQLKMLAEFDLLANISVPTDAATAEAVKLNGVGLFRTELAFLHRSRPPTVMEQAAVYRDIARRFNGVVTIRTMDFGGDKMPVYLPFPKEENPLLGLRSIRHSMQNLDLLRSQLRAVALTAKECANVRVLLPMITQFWEVETARDMLEQAISEVDLPPERTPPLGVMLETPALIYELDNYAKIADFASIGTNDFVQYMLAVDRYSETVGHLYSPFHPGIVRALDHIANSAPKSGMPVSVCGELSSQPAGALMLAALGFRSLSIAPGAAMTIRYVLGSASKKMLADLRQGLLLAHTAAEVQAALNEQLKEIDPRLVNA